MQVSGRYVLGHPLDSVRSLLRLNLHANGSAIQLVVARPMPATDTDEVFFTLARPPVPSTRGGNEADCLINDPRDENSP